MMKKMNCPECGGEIVVTREVAPITFAVEGEKLEDISNVVFQDAELIFHCSNDREHDIEPHPDPFYPYWVDQVSEYFSRHILPNL